MEQWVFSGEGLGIGRDRECSQGLCEWAGERRRGAEESASEQEREVLSEEVWEIPERHGC
jgi:hypothetical protein